MRKVNDGCEEPFLITKNRKFRYGKNFSDEEKVEEIQRDLKSGLLYWSLKRSVKAELIKSKYSLEEIGDLIPRVLGESGLKVELENEIFELDQSGSKSEELSRPVDEHLRDVMSFENDGLDYVRNVSRNWSLFLRDQMLSISRQLGVPLARLRGKGEEDQDSNTFNKEVDDDDDDDDGVPKYTGVFGPSKFFETLIEIRNPNHEETFSNNLLSWGLVKVEIGTASVAELRAEYGDLCFGKRFWNQLNVAYTCSPSDQRNTSVVPLLREYLPPLLVVGESPRSEHVEVPNEVLEEKRSRLSAYRDESGRVRLFQKEMYENCKMGLPPEARKLVWKHVLLKEYSCSGDNFGYFERKKYFRKLLGNYKKIRLLIDDMILNDIKRTCDDENYFVFETTLLLVMKAFSRDNLIAKKMKLSPIPIVSKVGGKGRVNMVKEVTYPPNGIVPFEGLSLLCAPICYIWKDPVDVFFVFRNLYAQLWANLHIISEKKNSILHLAKLFENLLMKKKPQLFYHLLELNIHPLDIAVPWLFHAFAGFLKVDQLLELWDRVIAFKDLKIIPILAVGIFCLRENFIINSKNSQAIIDVFRDFTAIQVVPVIQLCLFV